MVDVRAWVRGCACLVWLASGCGREALVTVTVCDDLAPGDFVITEIHANPGGSDGVAEYVEIFNASDSDRPLEGLTLTTHRADGLGSKSHRFLDASIEAGDYFVVGNASAAAMPSHLDYSYGESLGNLRNSDAVLSIHCGEMLIDEVRYEHTTDGRALEFDGRFAPHHELNDEPGNWCATPTGVDEVFPNNLGSPGSANSPCDEMPLEDGCMEGGAARAVVMPQLGEVRITEWMANPAGPDGDFEWVEAAFEANVDLNGFQLGPEADALQRVSTAEECFPVDAGTRVVFGASPAAAPRVDGNLRFNLGNTGLRSIVAAADGLILDRVDYEGTSEGRAWQIDSEGAVCVAPFESEYRPDNFGTPGQLNLACPLTLGPGMCFEEGRPREILSPRPGQVWITEWMANPASVGNREGEWLELRFDADADLNGLVLSDLTATSTKVESDDCLPVEAGEHLVLARSANPSENGGVEEVDAELSLSLNNSDETVTLSVGGQLLDSVSYVRSTAGVATQIDELGNRCEAVHSYGDGDLGTPGLANPWCA